MIFEIITEYILPILLVIGAILILYAMYKLIKTL